MNFGSLKVYGVLAALALLSQQTFAADFLSINFDGDTIGAAPTTNLTPGSPVTQPTAIGGYTATTEDSPPTPASGTIVVGDVGGMSKAVIMTTNPDNAEQGALYLDNNGFSAAGQQMKIAFDINVITAPASAHAQLKFLDGTSNTVGILFGMNAFTTDTASGQQSVRFAAAPTSASGGIFGIRTPDNTNLITIGSYTNGQTYHIELNADYDTGLVNASIDGVPSSNANLPFLLSGSVSNAVTGEYFMFLNGESGVANSVAIDNITASASTASDAIAVPEPASLGILGVGAASLLMKRRRKH